MPQRLASLIASILLISFFLPGCAYTTAQGRREMAYRHYVNKCMKQRRRQIAKAQKAANRKLRHDWQSRPQVPSEPIVQSSVEPSDRESAPVAISSAEPTETTSAEPEP